MTFSLPRIQSSPPAPCYLIVPRRLQPAACAVEKSNSQSGAREPFPFRDRLTMRSPLSVVGGPTHMMKKLLFTVVFTAVATVAFAQDVARVQRLFEAGQYQQVVDAAPPDGDPAVLYTAAQSHQKL